MAKAKYDSPPYEGEETRAQAAAAAAVVVKPEFRPRRRRSQELRPGSSERAFYPLLELTLARLREYWREPGLIFWIFAFPLLLAFALGIAFRNTGPEKISVAVEKAEGAAAAGAANALAETLARSGEVEAEILSPDEASKALRTGRISLIVRPAGGLGEGNALTLNPSVPGAAQDRAADTPTHLFDYRYDPTRPESRTARLVVDDKLQRALGRTDRARAGDEKVTETGARYIDFLVPGLLGMNLMGSGVWGVGLAVVVARTRKLLKRFAATPMKRSHYLLSFVLSRLIFLVLEVTLILVFAWLVFGFKVQGSLLVLALLLLIGALTFSGIGLLLAARTKTVEAVSGLMNLFMLPMWVLSGTFFSSSRFPDFIQPFIKALPLTAFNNSLRAVMNDGASLSANLTPLSIMLAWGIISFILALRTFRWQ